MTRRFYAPDAMANVELELGDEEAHHLIHVLRAHRGDTIEVFDGMGRAYSGHVLSAGRKSVRVSIKEGHIEDPQDRFPVDLFVALPKGDRQSWLVEKSTELGVRQLVPMIAERGVAQPSPAAQRRLRRAVIQACKQSGRNRLMQVAEPQRLDTYPVDRSTSNWLADPAARRALVDEILACRTASAAGVHTIAIGPEGGFTQQELEMADERGWHRMHLGGSVLRVETAAIASAVLLRQLLR